MAAYLIELGAMDEKEISDRIYTIGYAGLSVEAFIRLMAQFKIDVVIDVRSNPHSQYHADYDIERMRPRLKNSGIEYRSYKEEFGARQTDRSYMGEDGCVDFGLFSLSDGFKAGFRRVSEGIDKGYRVCLMCAEKNPEMCHRTIMVSRRFYEAGYHVLHILHDGSTETQLDVEEKLLKKHFPNRSQVSLFDENNHSDKEYIDMAYKKQNEAIGYRPENERDADGEGGE